MKTILLLECILLLVVLGSCWKEDDSISTSNPITTHLSGTWILEKIVTPSKVWSGADIGYSGKMVMEQVDGYMADLVYRDDTLFAKNFRTNHPRSIVSQSKKTIIMHYRDGRKRFYKFSIVPHQPTILEASEYLPELGTAADTVTYYYSQNWW